jgi:tetratricopeptide (TPR) repeat protein
VEGAVVRSGNRVRITANLLYAPADRHLWGETYERDLGDILSLQQEVARAIAREVNATLSHQEEANLTKPRPIKPEALEAYLRGQAYAESATEPALKNSVAYLKRAIEIDPDYAPAYAALGEVYYSLADLSYMPDKEAYALEEKAASKAFKLDETLVDAQVELAVLKEYYDWDELGAEREYRRIVTMNPNHAGARLRFAYNLAKMGQRGESLAEFRHWQELDPVAAASGKPVLYYFIRQYDQAIEECRKVLVIDPTSRDHSWLLGLAYVQKGRFEEAIEELQKAVEYSGGSPLHKASLAYAYAVSGRRHGALRLIEELKQRRAKGGYVSAYDIAVAYAGLNEKDLVLQWLNKAFEERAGGLPWVKVDPRLDLMRSDARFRDLLHRMNFPP